MQRH
jgi:hypothetical protein